jgi:manganese transport protein
LENLEKPIYKKIAITIDFSSVDSICIQSAMAQGGKNASYLLVHVVETAGAIWYGSEIADSESSVDTASLQDYLDQLKQQGYQVEMQIGYGNPKQIIPELVTKFDADLLVMGAHGHKWAKDLIFGTTVDTVRHRVAIPVLIVR